MRTDNTDTVKHRQQTDGYMEAGRKVLYLQVASDKELHRRALVIFLHLILSVMSFLFVFFFFYRRTHAPSPPKVPR